MSRGSTLAAVEVLDIFSVWNIFEKRRIKEPADTTGRVERALVIARASDVALALADGLREKTHQAGQKRTEECGIKRHVHRVSRRATRDGLQVLFDRYAHRILL